MNELAQYSTEALLAELAKRLNVGVEIQKPRCSTCGQEWEGDYHYCSGVGDSTAAGPISY